jgi:integrase
MARQARKVAGVYEKYPGSGDWYIQYRLTAEPGQKQGKLVRKMIGTRQQAIDYLNKVKHIRASGEGFVPSSARQVARTFAEESVVVDAVIFGTLCDGLRDHIRKNPTEYKDQRNPPQRIELIKKEFGHRQANSIKPYEISDWLSGLDLAPATRNRYKAVVSAIFRYGKERDKVQINPARDVKQARVNNGVIRFLTTAEEERLRTVLQSDVDACGPKNQQRRKHLLHGIHELTVGIGTGMRKSEQYDLRWPDVDFQRREITARDTKNGTTRIVPMIDDVYDAMKALKKMPLPRKQRSSGIPNSTPNDAVFSVGDNKKWFGTALRRAKIKNFRWHDLRHTFCSRLAQSGASLKVIQEAAGHKTIQMAARYSHMDRSTMREAMMVLNRKKTA